MQDKIIAAIAAYLERNEDTIYDTFRNKTKYNTIATEIAADIAPLVEPKDYPYPELFDHMANEHGLTLTDTELADIIQVARCK